MSGFTSQGYIRKSAEEVRQGLENDLKAKYPNFQRQTADIQNNIIDTGTILLLELENIKADICNSYAPLYANDFMWQMLANTLNIKAKDETKDPRGEGITDGCFADLKKKKKKKKKKPN